MRIRLLTLGPQEIKYWTEQILDVYRQAFEAPPYNTQEEGVQSFGLVLPRHSLRSGFRFHAAYDEETQQIAGFIYGYTSRPGQWWHDTIREAMPQAMACEWFQDTLELVELAVQPGAQGCGLGGWLHDTLLQNTPHRTALLSTYDGETNGMQLYRKRGWLPLLPHFYFPGGDKPMSIMGRQLR